MRIEVDYLFNRNGKLYFRRRVPEALRESPYSGFHRLNIHESHPPYGPAQQNQGPSQENLHRSIDYGPRHSKQLATWRETLEGNLGLLKARLWCTPDMGLLDQP